LEEWLTKGLELDNKVVIETTCLYFLSAVCNKLGQWLRHTNLPPTTKEGGTKAEATHPPTPGQPSKTTLLEKDAEWTYEIPYLSFGGVWYDARVCKLR
jgi:hypothetical protein